MRFSKTSTINPSNTTRLWKKQQSKSKKWKPASKTSKTSSKTSTKSSNNPSSNLLTNLSIKTPYQKYTKNYSSSQKRQRTFRHKYWTIPDPSMNSMISFKKIHRILVDSSRMLIYSKKNYRESLTCLKDSKNKLSKLITILTTKILKTTIQKTTIPKIRIPKIRTPKTRIQQTMR